MVSSCSMSRNTSHSTLPGIHCFHFRCERSHKARSATCKMYLTQNMSGVIIEATAKNVIKTPTYSKHWQGCERNHAHSCKNEFAVHSTLPSHLGHPIFHKLLPRKHAQDPTAEKCESATIDGMCSNCLKRAMESFAAISWLKSNGIT